MTKSKRAIAKEYEKITFMPLKGTHERKWKELNNVLNYTKYLEKARRKKIKIR